MPDVLPVKLCQLVPGLDVRWFLHSIVSSDWGQKQSDVPLVNQCFGHGLQEKEAEVKERL